MSKTTNCSPSQKKMEDFLNRGHHPPKQVDIGHSWDEVWTPEMFFLNRVTSGKSTKRRKNMVPVRKIVSLPPLPTLLKIFLFSMKVCGLFHMCEDSLTLDGRYTIKGFVILIAKKGMSLVVLLFCWGIVAFNLWQFPFRKFGFDANAFTCIVFLAFFTQNAISTTTYFIASARKKMFKKLFKKWSDIMVPEDVAEDITRYCQKAQYIVTSVGLIVTGVMIAVFMEIFFMHQELQDIFVNNGLEFNRSVLEAYGILAIISVFIWVFSLGFFVLICLVLRRLFYACHKALGRDIASNPGGVRLEMYRVRHEAINAILEIADNIYEEMIFSYFFNYMLLLCLVSYELLWMESVGDAIYIRGVWCIIAVGTILVICFAASSINAAAHKSFKYLHRMDLSQLSGDEHIQLVVYMLRLNGPPLGLTAWGIFTVTREVILTMASVFMTYLLILAQLKPKA